MNNEEYWKSRIDNIYDSNYHKNKLKKIYRKAFKDNERKILDLYDTLKDKGELSTTELYKFERFLSLQEELEKQTKEVNDSLYEQATKDLKQAYKDTFNETIDNIGSDLEWGIQNEKMLNKVLNKKWAGNNYSKRIWNNSKQLSEDIESAVVDCLTRGVSKDLYVKSIKNKYDVGFSKADRLVRTELMHTINEGQKDVYKAEGIKKVKWYAAEDERMCDICGKMHDKEYDIDNVPSIAHANCRCTIIPIINTDLTNTVDNLRKSDIISSERGLKMQSGGILEKE